MNHTHRLARAPLTLAAALALAGCQSLSTTQQAEWTGRYSGQIPCASCSGIQMTVTLEKDGRYQLLEEYSDTKGGRFAASGRYQQQAGSPALLTLHEQGGKRYFHINDGYLEMLDQQARPAQPEASRVHWRLYKIR